MADSGPLGTWSLYRHPRAAIGAITYTSCV